MKKIWSILLSILLGAAVVGLGTGYFLYLANKDRQLLAYEAAQAKLKAEQALEQSHQAIEEANQKVISASQEIDKAQSTLQALLKERELLETAEPLMNTLTKKQGWESILSPSFEISVEYPAGSDVIKNDETALVIAPENQSMENKWFELSSYNSSTFSAWQNNIASSTQVAYFIDGKLLAGHFGLIKDSENSKSVTILIIYKNGLTEQMLWIADPPPFKKNPWQRGQVVISKEILATFKFKKNSS
ncbi:MAG: PspA/IM30 family protein [Patescibacteria group bacterium]